METRRKRIEPNAYYHVYNRGINGQNIFFEEKNYVFFLQRLAKYVCPFVDIYAYCLLKNHFHLLLRAKSEKEIRFFLNGKKEEKDIVWHLSNAFSSFFQSYAQAINKQYGRTGGLFEEPFHRIEVEHETYFTQLIWYIHHNPERHGFIDDFKKYPHSSYHSHLDTKLTKLNRKEVIAWFGSSQAYQKFHAVQQGTEDINEVLIEINSD